MKTALTIAGSDSSGGAGIQADIKAMTMNGVYAMSVITSLTAQNTTGVRSISEVSSEFLKEQLDCAFQDIYPDAVKIGMVSNPDHIEVITQTLNEYDAKNIVIDPVMIATSGSKLVGEKAVSLIMEYLLPVATLVTPNIPEAEVLSGLAISGYEDMIKAALKIHNQYKCAVLLKGGHSLNDANDLLVYNGGYKWFNCVRINNPNNHGTGCTLSSAIASNLAKGFMLDEAVDRAKRYVTGALNSMLDLGSGSGPINHLFNLQGEYSEETEI